MSEREEARQEARVRERERAKTRARAKELERASGQLSLLHEREREFGEGLFSGREGEEIECQRALPRVGGGGGGGDASWPSSTTVSRAAQHGQFVGQFVGAAHTVEASSARHGLRTDETQALERRERRLVIFFFGSFWPVRQCVWEQSCPCEAHVIYIMYVYS